MGEMNIIGGRILFISGKIIVTVVETFELAQDFDQKI